MFEIKNYGVLHAGILTYSHFSVLMLFGIGLNVGVEVTILGVVRVKFMEILLAMAVLVLEGVRVIVVELSMLCLFCHGGFRFRGSYQSHSSQFDLCCHFRG